MKREVGIRELKANASEILRQVEEEGEEVIVTRRGRPVGRIAPLDRKVDHMGGLRDSFPHWPDLDLEDFIEVKRIWEPRDLPE